MLAAIDRPEVPGVRWTSPAQWHVTLRFLGDVADGEVGAVVDALEGCRSALAPVEVVLADRLGQFGRRVLHAGLVGLEGWAAVVAGLALPGSGSTRARSRSAAARSGDGRPFAGHVTLARSRRPSAALASLAGQPLPADGPRSWVASELTLVRSTLGRGGSTYERVFAITLM